MRLLLDTHVALWAITDDQRLSQVARDLISDAANIVHVSAATIWEITIKHSLARPAPNAMPVSGADALRYFTDAGYLLLSISAAHAAAFAQLPRLHADPFDRILVAQALAEPLRLISRDAMIASYSDTVIKV